MGECIGFVSTHEGASIGLDLLVQIKKYANGWLYTNAQRVSGFRSKLANRCSCRFQCSMSADLTVESACCNSSWIGEPPLGRAPQCGCDRQCG